ncbi:MAG TPA: hypothetical protein VLR49_03430, partial [Ferruginibacter sp.]|nr:hypothetical protein [Ferruginibacter sp.]
MKIKYLAVCCFLLTVNSNPVISQILNPKKLLEKKVINKTNQVIDKKAQQAVDTIFADKDGTRPNENKQAGNDVQGQKEKKATPVSGNQPSLQTYSKFDFIAGEKVIFFDDFTAENVGDFPVHWNTTGSGEVVTTNLFEGRWFNITNGRGATTLDEAITLSDNYTIEFDVVPQKDLKNGNNSGFSFSILSTTKPKDLVYGLARPGEAAIRFAFEYSTRYITYYRDGSPELSGSTDEPRLLADKKYKISIWVQKERIRLYVDKEKVFDLPKAMSKNYKYNMIRFDRGTTMIGNVRIATGLPDMRSKLMTEGKLVSYGIYFDVN